jgi:hypothetical protein
MFLGSFASGRTCSQTSLPQALLKLSNSLVWFLAWRVHVWNWFARNFLLRCFRILEVGFRAYVRLVLWWNAFFRRCRFPGRILHFVGHFGSPPISVWSNRGFKNKTRFRGPSCGGLPQNRGSLCKMDFIARLIVDSFMSLGSVWQAEIKSSIREQFPPEHRVRIACASGSRRQSEIMRRSVTKGEGSDAGRRVPRD